MTQTIDKNPPILTENASNHFVKNKYINLQKTTQKSFKEIEEECISAMYNNGFVNVPLPIDTSGNLVKFSGRDLGRSPRKDDRTEWYRANITTEGKLMMTYNSHHSSLERDDEHYIFVSGSYKPLNEEEVEELKKRVTQWQMKRDLEDAEEEKHRLEKAAAARERFKKASEIGKSAYLERKSVGAHGIRFERKGNETIVLVPMRNENGEIETLQEIFETKRSFGDKKFTNSSTGLFHVIGTLVDGAQIRISEGYATASSCYESTGGEVPHVVAFTSGAFQTIVPIIRKHYPNSQITICADNDDPKKNGGVKKAKKAAKMVDNCTVVYPKFPPGMDTYEKEGKIKYYNDFNDLMILLGKEEVKRQIENFVDEDTATENVPELAKSPINYDDVVNSLTRNERGDAELFLMLLKDKYFFDSSEGRSGEFYLWTGSQWQLDYKKQRYRDMERVSEYYESASIQAGKNEETLALAKLLNTRAFNLRGSKRCKSVFDFIAPEIHFSGEWDYCPGKLPCSNGIVDLKTGSLSENKPEYFIRSVCPTKYNPNAARPLFDKFLDDITLKNKELKSFLCRLLGAALIGNCKEEKVFIFYGENGRNGKGTLMQTLEKVLGGFAKTFPSEMLLLQRNPPSSSTPRPEEANLQGVRFAIFSEINKGRKIDSSKVKNYSGGDTISCRRLFSNKDIQIRPSHTMIIQTNFKPEAPSDDGALWKRNVLFPFKAEFVEDPDPTKPHQRKIDEGFKEKLLQEHEGILAWLVEGCMQYQQQGLRIPAIVREETENYRKENDGIGMFLSEMCIESPEFSTQKSKMQNAIKDFCKANGFVEAKRPEISSYLKSRYQEGRASQGDYWKGVKIVDEKEFNR